MKQAKQRKLLTFTLSWFYRVPPAPWERRHERLFVVCRKQATAVMPRVTFSHAGDYYGAQLESGERTQ